MREICLGDRFRFVPSVRRPDKGVKRDTVQYAGKYVTGTIVYINEPHRFFTVEYTVGETVQHECFKFFKLGDRMP